MRPLDATTKANIEASVVRPIFFVEAHFRTIVRRWASVPGTFEWNGYTWNGTAGGGSMVLSIGPVEEATGVEAIGLKWSLSGIPNTELVACLDEIRVGKACSLWFGTLDANGALGGTPYKLFGGRMDSATAEEGGESSTISGMAESELIRLQRPRLRTLTHQDQQIDFPGDKGLEYVDALQNWQGVWGDAKVIGGSSGGGGTDFVDYPSQGGGYI